MDLTASSAENDTPVILFPLHQNSESYSQQWRLRLVADPLFIIGQTYILRNRSTGSVADFSQYTRRVGSALSRSLVFYLCH